MRPKKLKSADTVYQGTWRQIDCEPQFVFIGIIPLSTKRLRVVINYPYSEHHSACKFVFSDTWLGDKLFRNTLRLCTHTH